MSNTIAYQRADYVAYDALMASLTVAQAHEIAEFRRLAEGYVWGWEDAKGNRIQEFTASWDFSILYAMLRASFILGKITSCPPIQDAWRCWLLGHEIGSHRWYCEG